MEREDAQKTRAGCDDSSGVDSGSEAITDSVGCTIERHSGDNSEMASQNPGVNRDDLSEHSSNEIQFAISKSEGQLLEDVEKVGPMVTSACFPLSVVPVPMSPSNDDQLASQKAVFHPSRRRDRETSRVVCIGDDSGRGFWKISEGQSSIDKDIQGAETQFATSESEGQLLEDIEKVGSMVTSACFPLSGVPVSMSPSNDDPLASQKAVDQLRRERSLRPSHVVDGGGAASQSYQFEGFEFERPYFGPSHVVNGGGAEFKPSYSEHHEVELPTESHKTELRRRILEIEQVMSQDSRFYAFLWSVKHDQSGLERYKAIEKFWQKVYEC
jgi:hypothetical protein